MHQPQLVKILSKSLTMQHLKTQAAFTRHAATWEVPTHVSHALMPFALRCEDHSTPNPFITFSLSPISTIANLISYHPQFPLLFHFSIVLFKPPPDWLKLSTVLQVAPLSIVLLWHHSLLFSHGHSHALAVYKPLGRQHVFSDLI